MVKRAVIVLLLFSAACSGVPAGGGGGVTSPTPVAASTPPPTILSVQRWTGSLEILATQDGSGSTSFAGYSINEAFRHESTARFTVTLSKDPNNGRRWIGSVQGAVAINNKNTMTMIAPVGGITCVGTLFWIGNEPLFTTDMTLEADASASTYKFWLAKNTIPAPNAGGVICPTTGLQFPTTDPNSPFAPKLETELAAQPVNGLTGLSGTVALIGDSGIGGFIASPERVVYTVDWNLRAP